jgi:hypothetical protein
VAAVPSEPVLALQEKDSSEFRGSPATTSKVSSWPGAAVAEVREEKVTAGRAGSDGDGREREAEKPWVSVTMTVTVWMPVASGAVQTVEAEEAEREGPPRWRTMHRTGCRRVGHHAR